MKPLLLPAFASLLPAILAFAPPARAEVVERSDAGFVVRQTALVSASAEDAWRELIAPQHWWSKRHTFSGDAANLSLDPAMGGCFCEVLPAGEGATDPAPRGGVVHMRVIHADRPRVLRMEGALGPLQGEALKAVLTVTIKPVEGGTRLLWEYVVGGFMRFKSEQIAPAVDGVLGEQLTGLAAKLGPLAAAPEPAPAVPVPADPAPASEDAPPAAEAAPAPPPLRRAPSVDDGR